MWTVASASDQVSTLPRQLLHYIGQRLGLPTPTIASLRTLYRRYKTLYDHLIWASGYVGLKSIRPDFASVSGNIGIASDISISFVSTYYTSTPTVSTGASHDPRHH